MKNPDIPDTMIRYYDVHSGIINIPFPLLTEQLKRDIAAFLLENGPEDIYLDESDNEWWNWAAEIITCDGYLRPDGGIFEGEMMLSIRPVLSFC